MPFGITRIDNLVTLKRILTHVLQEHGFDVYERDDVLFGEREEARVAVGIFVDCGRQQVSDFLAKVKEVDGSRVIASARAITSEIKDMAASNDISVWHLADIEREIGRAVIDHIGREEAGDTPFFGEIIRASLEGRGGETDGFPVVINDLGTGESDSIQKPNITLDDVKEISRNTIKGFKFDLELLPHYLFEYLCIFEGKGGKGVKRTGLIEVNAFTGFPELVDKGLELVGAIEIPHIKIEPKIDEEDALSTAVRKVIELNTEHDDVIIEKEHATVTERTVFKPGEGDITLTKKGLIHVPVWCVEGTHGVMIINGTTGKIISEEYYGQAP